MPRQFSSVVLLFVSLAVILHYGSQIRAKVFPETVASPPTTAAVQATAKPSFLSPADQVPPRTSAARSLDECVPSQTAATASTSETPTTHTTIKPLATTSLATTNSTPPASPGIHALGTSMTTLNSAHAATGGPHTAPASLPTALTPLACTTGTSPPTASHTSGRATQPSNQTTLPATLSTPSHNSTSSRKPVPPTHTPGHTAATRSTSQTASPAPSAPGPTLAPQPSSVKTGTYEVLNGSRLCIKSEMGIELAVQETESVFSPQRYFNLDPNGTHASGNCGFRRSNLLLNFQGGFVNLTFTKEEDSYYVSEVGAYLTVSNPEKIYQGMKSAVVMFETMVGHSFKCVSEQSMQLSTHLQLKTMNVRLQAFDFEDDHFGNADACFSDRNRREAPLAVGLSIAGLLVILLTACLVARERPTRGYECIAHSEDLGKQKRPNKLDECSSDYTIVLPVIGAIVLGLCAVGLIVYGIRLKRESSGYQRI